MDEINLLTCVNHIKKVVSRLEYYVKNECPSNVDNMTIDELEGLKEGYAQVVWIEEMHNSLLENLRCVKKKYENIIDPVLGKIEHTLQPGCVDEKYSLAEYSLKLPGFDMYYKLWDDSNYINNSTWGEEQERMDTVSDLISLRLHGYPEGINNVIPLKMILSNPFRYCVGTLDAEDIPVPSDEVKKINKIDDVKYNLNENILGEYEYECGGAVVVLPVINSLKNIPLSMYYYYGDRKENDRGVYIKISPNVVIKIPMVDVIPEDMENSRLMTVRCNNDCVDMPCDYWKCSYTHNGVPYNKIGYKNRCPSNPGFSNKDTLKADIETVDFDSIRMCLLNLLSDLFSVSVWCQEKKKNKKKEIIIYDLELCGTYPDPFPSEFDGLM